MVMVSFFPALHPSSPLPVLPPWLLVADGVGRNVGPTILAA